MNDMNLHLESSRTSTTKRFCENRLTAKTFIVDIRPGSKYTSDERNKLFSFQIKATTLGICMCSKKLLLWKNQKGSTR